MDENTFDPNLVHALFKSAWKRKALDRERNEGDNALNCEVRAEISKKSRTTSDRAFKEEAFFTGAEAVQHAAIIAEAKGISQIEATRLERILPQLLLDF